MEKIFVQTVVDPMRNIRKSVKVVMVIEHP